MGSRSMSIITSRAKKINRLSKKYVRSSMRRYGSAVGTVCKKTSAY